MRGLLALLLMQAALIGNDPFYKEMIKDSKDPKDSKVKKCHYCGVETDRVFCSSNCCKEYQRIMKELKNDM